MSRYTKQVPSDCVVCGNPLPDMTGGRRYCSSICAFRAYNLKSLYNMTPEQYRELEQRQQGRCAICGSTEPGDKRSRWFVIDHDHETGIIRGLLCALCNRAIGLLKDSPTILRNAADYSEVSCVVS